MYYSGTRVGGKDKVVLTEEEVGPQQQPKPGDNKDTTTYWDIQ
jgi:hypothetical protein